MHALYGSVYDTIQRHPGRIQKFWKEDGAQIKIDPRILKKRVEHISDFFNYKSKIKKNNNNKPEERALLNGPYPRSAPRHWVMCLFSTRNIEKTSFWKKTNSYHKLHAVYFVHSATTLIKLVQLSIQINASREPRRQFFFTFFVTRKPDNFILEKVCYVFRYH